MADKTSLKQKFLKKWVKGLQIYSSSKKLTTVMERKSFIKLSADIAMALAREGTAKWSRALVASAYKNPQNKSIVEQISGHATDLSRTSTLNKGQVCRLPDLVTKKITRKKILKRIQRARKGETPSNRLPASSIAKRLVKKRTQLLKKIVPGGESMDDVSLIKETLDYIMSLRAQVDVMRSLVYMSEHLDV